MRNRIGLHIGSNPYITGWGDHIKALDAAGIPAVVMSVAGEGFGDIEACWDNGSTVPHIAIIRCLSHNDVPRYDLDVQVAVEDWLNRYVPTIGNDVKKYHERVITKHGNELDKNHIQWLADFYTALHPALLQRMGWDSHRICVFNFSGGEPEYGDWESILPFLRLAGENPDKFVIGVHEYSFDENDIFAEFPYFVGRCVSHLYDVCDKHGVKRPKVGIHEFGWRDKKISPTTAQAMADIDAAMEFYAREMGEDLLGCGVWTSQPWQDSGIEKEVQKLIAPLTQLTLSKEYEVGTTPIPEPKPKIVVMKKPQIHEFSLAANQQAGVWAYETYGRTTTHSVDDMARMLSGGNAESYAVIVDPWRNSQQGAIAWCVDNGYNWQGLNITTPPSETFRFTHWPTSDKVVTQRWANDPTYYQQFGLPGHEGVDMRAAHGSPIYAVAAGVVGDLNSNPSGHNYGIFVRVNHVHDYQSTYAHLERIVVSLGQTVVGGQILGYADNTGNSFGSHLHLTLKRLGYTYTDVHGVWPHNITDPTPYLQPFNPVWPGVQPPAASVLVLPYLRGIDRVQFDMAYTSGTQTTQVRHFPTRWIYVKGEHREYECFYLAQNNGADWIHRAEDTSESPTRFYAHYSVQGGVIGAPWVPAVMEIGRWYESRKFVQHYTKTFVNGVWNGGCTPANGGNVVDRIRLISAPYSKTYRSGKTLSVITLEWAAGEQYDFAAEFGNVAFRDANREFWFMEGPLLGRTDKQFTKPNCINLGW